MTKGKSFREAMKRGMVAAPGCYDCVTRARRSNAPASRRST